MTDFVRTCWALVVRDWRVRFRRTLLGMAWFFVPLLGLVAAAMYMGQGAGLYEPQQATHYLVRLLAGLMLWQLFADAWLEPMRLSRRAIALLRAFSFDARVLLGAGALSALAAFAVKLPVLVAALWWFDWPIHPAAWWVLPGVVLLVAAGAALACFTLPAGLALYDVRYGLPLVQWGLLLATPIFYEHPPGSLLERLVALNPLSALVPPVRDALVASPAPAGPLLHAALVVLPLLALGLAYFGVRVRLATAYLGH